MGTVRALTPILCGPRRYEEGETFDAGDDASALIDGGFAVKVKAPAKAEKPAKDKKPAKPKAEKPAKGEAGDKG